MIKEIGRPTLRAPDLRHTYASLARRAVADPISTAPEDAGSCVYRGDSAHHADLYDDELDDVASALDALTTLVETTPDHPSDHVRGLAGYWPDDIWCSLLRRARRDWHLYLVDVNM